MQGAGGQFAGFGQQAGGFGGGYGGQAVAPPAPSPWQALQDEAGRTYYWNSMTGQSQWEKPAGMA